MNHAGRIGNPKSIEVFAQLLHFIAARDAVILEICRSRLGVVRFQLEPDVGVADVWDPINPQLDRSELEDATFRFLLKPGCRFGVGAASPRPRLRPSGSSSGRQLRSIELTTSV